MGSMSICHWVIVLVVVMLAQFNLTPQQVLDELARREGISGIEEKAARKDELRDALDTDKH